MGGEQETDVLFELRRHTYRPAPVFESRGSETQGPPNLAHRPAPAAIDECDQGRSLAIGGLCCLWCDDGRREVRLCLVLEQSKVTGGECSVAGVKGSDVTKGRTYL